MKGIGTAGTCACNAHPGVTKIPVWRELPMIAKIYFLELV